MEVHYHPHSEQKKFREYFYDFFMMFIAVTLGFFAENLREYISDHHREKEYVRSLIEDIKEDTARIDFVVGKINERDHGIDTFLALLTDPRTLSNSNRLIRLRENLGFPDFIYTDRTIQQLKNTGQLRLIRRLNTSNLIIAYDVDARNALVLDNILNNIISGVIIITNRTLDFSQVGGWPQGIGYDKLQIPQRPIPLLVSDRKSLIEYHNNISDYKRFALGFNGVLNSLRGEGVKLIGYLRHEYNLKEEKNDVKVDGRGEQKK